jgi:thiamine pyrophosphate-dependent acetolactate synthase large subunit-like protein
MKAIDAVVNILQEEGVENLFCFPSSPLIDAAAKVGIRPIMARTERTAIGMADGFSRVRNGKQIGVCTVQYGPGVENSFAGIAQAYADASPILFLPAHLKRERAGSTRNFQAVPSYRPITKWAEQINLPQRVPQMLRRAFSYLRNGRLGPVLLELPLDVASSATDSDSYKSPKRVRSAGDPAAIAAAVKALLKAKCPLVYVGQGVFYADAMQELIEFAQLAGAPVMTTLLGKSAFPEDHCLSIGTGGYTATKAVAHFVTKADVILGIGCSFSQEWMAVPIPGGKTVVQVTNDDHDLNADLAIDLGILGDAKLVLSQLSEELRRQAGAGGRDSAAAVKEISEVKQSWFEEWMPLVNSDEVPLNPYRVMRDIAQTVDRANTIITHDSGFVRDQMIPFYESIAPRGYLGWGNSTQMGQSIALALGAKVAAPEKTVINVTGDASFGMLGMEVETAARHKIGILTVMLNNGGMCGAENYLGAAAERYNLHKLTGEYWKVAAALGAASEWVDSPREIVPAIRRAQEAMKTGQPAFLEFMTKQELKVARFW